MKKNYFTACQVVFLVITLSFSSASFAGSCTKSSSDGGLQSVVVKTIKIKSSDLNSDKSVSSEAWEKAAKQAQDQFGGEITHNTTTGVSMMFSFKVGFAPPIPVRHQIRIFPDQSVYKSVLEHHPAFGEDVEEKYVCDDVTETDDTNQQGSNGSPYPSHVLAAYRIRTEQLAEDMSTVSAHCPYSYPYNVCTSGEVPLGRVSIEHVGQR